MVRPLFEIAKEISADWKEPSPPAKSYLKGMLYLLGMDDIVGDLNATTAIRMFLLYSKTWTGPVADRVKTELQTMRSANAPNNADLLKQVSYSKSLHEISHCEVCHASFSAPAKFVEGYTYWNKCVRMCSHCNYFVSSGLYDGNGALYLADETGHWLKLHGEPKLTHTADTVLIPDDNIIPVSNAATRPNLQFHLKLLGRKVLKRIKAVAYRWTRRSA